MAGWERLVEVTLRWATELLNLENMVNVGIPRYIVPG